ncbi:MAG: ferritin-like protein [Pseudomonadota bacterium]
MLDELTTAPQSTYSHMHKLLRCPDHEHTIEWLQHALQTAITLEFATVPLYLTALWSIEDPHHEAAHQIRNVVHEEMLHFALACNLLSAIGGEPALTGPAFVPHYPGGLPDPIEKGIDVWLGGLSDALLDCFIRIERPELPGDPVASHADYATIGAFYGAILKAFQHINPPLAIGRQITGAMATMVIHDLKGVEGAIRLIQHQGEGAQHSDCVPGTDDMAHFYRFLSVKHHQEVIDITVNDKNGSYTPVFGDKQWDAPLVWPVANVPKGGYLKTDVAPDVWSALRSFDEAYTAMLDSLQSAWSHGDQTGMIHGIEQMFRLTELGRALMQYEIPGTNQRYAPCFRYISR